MKPAPLPLEEERRLETLRRYAILDTAPEEALDNLTQLAAVICEAPIAMISLVDEHRQWFKSRIGFAPSETTRDISFCAHALLQADIFVVPDALADARFADNPLVTGERGIRFYAGAPLIAPTGDALGTLCVKDHVPRTLTPVQAHALRVLAQQVVAHLELTRQTREFAESEQRLRAVTENARVGLVTLTQDRRYAYANHTYAEILGLASPEIVGQRVEEVLRDIYEDQIRLRLDRAFAGERITYDLRRRTADGERHYEVKYEPKVGAGQGDFVVVVITEITARKQAEIALHESVRFAQSTIDALSDQICVLDETGTILATNKAWQRFADENPPVDQRASTGDNYLQVCDTATGLDEAEAKATARGIRAILRGELMEFTMEYACPSPSERRWMVARVTRFPGEGPVRVVVAHENVTARKKAEAVSQRLAAIVASSDDAIIGKDLNGMITSWNRGAEGIFGYTAQEMVGTSILRLIPADRHDEETHILGEIKRGVSVEHFETLRQTKDGRLIDISVTASPIRDATGKILGVSKIARDISKRKQTEAALLESEGRYRTLFEYAPDGILIADAECRYIDANASICRMLGYSRLELIGLHATDIVVPAEIPHIAPALQVIKATSDYRREWQFRRKDGSIFPAEVIATMMPDGHLLGLIRDITERKRTQDRFRRLVDSNVQGVMFWNVKGEITGANDAFLKIVGYSSEDLAAGRIDWQAMTPAEYAERDCCSLQEIASHGICAPYEKEYVRKDGSRVSVLVGSASFQDDPSEGVCFVLDLTERKKLEQQFLRAQRMESIGTLAGGIAHDLNNVLAPILMALEVLRIKFPDPASANLLSILNASAQRGADMVRQVLSFARGVEGRRMELQVKHLLRDIEGIANDTFLKHIQIRTIVPHDLWTVLGDPTQLHQVLLNLCVNARDAMPHGGILTISAEDLLIDAQYAGLTLEAKPGPYVLIQVEDSGTGMPPGVIEKIFDPFFTTKEIGKGTGLGLSTSLAIVKSHGGFIRAYSELGKGSKFKVYLPAQTEASPEAAAEAAAEMPRGHGELILVVDDEFSVRQITQQTLEAFGYRVILAEDGAEALMAYSKHGEEIAIVVTDMTMPIMDGAATIRVLRKLNPKLPIIAASGLSANGQTAEAAALGVKCFLAKPYTAETLLKALRQALAG